MKAKVNLHHELSTQQIDGVRRFDMRRRSASHDHQKDKIMLVKTLLSLGAAGMFAVGAQAQSTNEMMNNSMQTMGKTSDMSMKSNMPMHHHTMKHRGHCHWMMRHGKKYRMCKPMKMHHKSASKY